MILRDATPEDAPAIARVHVRSWQVGYRGIVPDEVLDAQSEAERERLWRDLLGQSGEHFTLVAEAAGVIVGFGTGLTTTGEVAALYVDPDHFGQGAGGRLLEAVAERLGGDVALWVLEGNASARGFYAVHGFAPDGARSVHASSGEEQIRLVRQAAP